MCFVLFLAYAFVASYLMVGISPQGKYVEAGTHLHNALRALNRPLPTSKFDLCASLFWQMFRQFLHRIHIGRWLSDRAGKFWGHVSTKDVRTSARDAAVVYHKLHQLHLTGKQSLMFLQNIMERYIQVFLDLQAM